MTIRKPKISHRFEYVALRCVEAAVNIIPRKAALVLGATTGRMLCLLGIYRKTVLKNFEYVGIWKPHEVRKILPKLYRNIGRYTVDFLRKNSKPLPPYQLRNYDIYTEAHAKGRGTIIILAHFGNWELLAAIFGCQVDNLNVVAKPMGNPLVEEWLHRKRTALSVKTIHTRNALRGILSVIKANGTVALLIDQYFKMGTPAPFLGKTAATVRTAAGMAHKTGAPTVPVYAILEADDTYSINITTNGTVYSDGCDADAAITAIQTRHNDIISQWIIEYPEHWFGWFHRRFRGYVDYK